VVRGPSPSGFGFISESNALRIVATWTGRKENVALAALAPSERESAKRLECGRAAPSRTHVTDGRTTGVRSRLGKPKRCAYAPAMKG
jgi:hypothetical protein